MTGRKGRLGGMMAQLGDAFVSPCSAVPAVQEWFTRRPSHHRHAAVNGVGLARDVGGSCRAGRGGSPGCV